MPADFNQDTDSLDVNIFEFDPVIEIIEQEGERVAIIRTTDRMSYRGCRRRWGWQSHLRGNLETRTKASPLWYGSGFHYALEDFHGPKVYKSAADAFYAYVEATKIQDKKNMPGDWQELRVLAKGMLDYYENEWIAYRDPLQTFIYNGIPQTEVNFRVEIPWPPGKFGIDKVIYSGTIDRVVWKDEFLWGVEYKTAKIIQTLHLANDPQVSAYSWALPYLYPGYPIAGICYQQHRKDIPVPPRWTASGFSCDKRQLTTPIMYQKALEDAFGSVNGAPERNREFLVTLYGQEDLDFTKFVRRDWSRRNEHQRQAEGEKILMEVEEMLNPDLPLYPSPDRSCQFLCSFVGPCVSLDEGGDWEYELQSLMKPKEGSYDSWRKYLPEPSRLPGVLKEQAEMNRPLFDE